MKRFIFTISIIFLFIASVNLNAQDTGQWDILNEGGDFNAIDFVNEQVGWVAGKGTLLKTEDGGETWNSLPLDDKWYISLIDFISDSVGWVSGWSNSVEDHAIGSVILKTMDGGQTWSVQKVLPDENYLSSIRVINESIIYAIGSYYDYDTDIGGGKIWKSSDGGLSWIDVFPDLTNKSLNSVWFFNAEVGIITGESSGQGLVLKTFDGGQTWMKTFSPNSTK